MPTTNPVASPVRVGLCAGGQPVPLTGVKVDAAVTAVSARVTITQRYRNDEAHAIEADYVFPLDDGAAVDRFEAVVDGVHYLGEVLDRDEAFARYDDALTGGHGGYLLDMEASDVLRASIGNVRPGGEVLVRISYVAELPLEGRALRVVLPTTVSPRYAPAEDRSGIGESRADVLNPPVQWTVPYGLDLTIRAEMPGRIRRVESPSHPVSVALDEAGAVITLTASTTALDRDVVVLIDADGVHEPSVRVERDAAGRLAAAVTMTATFDAAEAPADVVFLVDRSGSMQGSSIAEVRNALQLCLRSLTPGCAFNIVGFGTTWTTLFPCSRPYDAATLEVASAHIATLDADLGGTELLPALDYVLQQPGVGALPRRVVLLTDGDVTNVEAVLAAVAGSPPDTRVFTFGIGHGPSAALVRGVARVGRGEAEFIKPGERMEAKVMRQFARLFTAALDDVQIDWGGLQTIAVAGGGGPVFAGSRLVRYALLDRCVDTHVVLRGRHGERTHAWRVPLLESAAAPGGDIASLAARARITEIEDTPSTLRARGSRQGERVTAAERAEVKRLALAHGLLSRETSLVAVERRAEGVQGPIELRRIPVALRAGWGGLRAGLPSLAAARLPQSMQMSVFTGATLFCDSVSEQHDPWTEGPAGALALGRRTGRTFSRTRPLDRVVALQAADGRWEDPARLAEAAGLPKNRQRQLRTAIDDGGFDPAAFATIFALAWLERCAAAEQVEWRRLAAKAEAWLAAHVAAERLATMRAAATELLRGQ